MCPASACRRPAPPPQDQSASAGASDRHELVLQPRHQETYAQPAHALRILLLSEKTSIRTGEDFRYRLEVKNIGRDPIVFNEAPPSFIKDSSLCGERDFLINVMHSSDAEQPLPCPAVSARGSALDVTLLPGEVLLTRPDGPTSRFRKIAGKNFFTKPGKYRIRVVYAAGNIRAESNTVDLEVGR